MQTVFERLKESIISESYEDRAGRSVISVKSVLDIVDRLAAEQQKDSGWILCSERLPEIAGYEVLATLENAIGQRRVTVIFTGYGINPPWHCNHKEFDLAMWKVIAWKPLPAPCKVGQFLAAEQQEEEVE